MSVDPYRVGPYRIGRLLGAGTFSRVFTATDDESHEYAMKIVNRVHASKPMDDSILKEVAIMQCLRHANVAHMKQVLKSKKHFYVVTELLPGGELAQELKAQVRFTEDLARSYFQQLISGVCYIHSKGIAHRDLKLQNLILDAEGRVKISDFGLSSLQLPDRDMWTVCGTVAFMAPEVLARNGYNGFAADLWSCGVILYTMLVGERPFRARRRKELQDLIRAGGYEPYPPELNLSPDVRHLTERLLTVDPAARITESEILQHPWFAVNFNPAMLQGLA